MQRCFLNLFGVTSASMSAIVMSLSCFPAFPAIAQENEPTQITSELGSKLEEVGVAFANVYYTLGICDGFVAPQVEAPLDPFGPMLEKWPDGFKKLMAETREEGRIEGLRLTRLHRLTFDEQVELCRGLVDESKADIDSLRARYLK